MAAEKKTKTPKEKVDQKEHASFLDDGRASKIAGLIFIATALLLLFSFISYFFNYKTDQSEVLTQGANVLTNADAKVQNVASRFGAYISHLFIDQFFGIGAFVLVYLIGGFGLNLLLQRKVISYLKTIGYSILSILIICLFFGFINAVFFPENTLNLGGGMGNFMAGHGGYLPNLIGNIGTGIFILVVSLTLIIWFYNIDFNPIFNIPLGQLFTRKNKNIVGAVDLSKPSTSSTFIPDDSIFNRDNIADNGILEVEKNEVKEDIITIPKYAEKAVETENVFINPPIDNDDDFEIITNEEIIDNEDQFLEVNPIIEEAESNSKTAADEVLNLPPFDPRKDLGNYKFPSIDLLDEHGSNQIRMDKEELERNKTQIIETLKNYNIEISKIRATIGPTVTLYEIVPAPGVRISKIKNLEDDIALSLAALGIRIIAPIPGKGTIGIEVPNEHKEIVSMRSILASEKFKNTTMDLPIGLGKNIANEIYIADLAKMPHLLMAGATGQGKSVGINSILISLLYKKHPSELKFVLVDPKKVELSIYSTIEKHFLAKLPGEEDAIITDVKKVVNTLNSLCILMDERYDLLKKAGVRNLKEYNQKFIERKLNPEKGHHFMPYVVLVIDEFADLIMTAGKEVEMPVARLAQLARAIGIHLILATQRPSVNIITGTIKANFPARISFKVTSKIDSRTILDAGGAEQLIGRGDMLLSLGSDLIRLQCGFLDTPEVEKVSKHVEAQQGYPSAYELPEYFGDDEEGGRKENFDPRQKDEFFEEAARLIVQNQVGSTSLIQRRMKLGYNRAGRIMDQLEQAGIVGPNLGSKARDVNFRTEEELERFLETIR